MILALVETDLLILESWKAVHYINGKQGNIQKHYIRPLPGFDETNFPFLMCSGHSHFSLINVVTGKRELMIDASCSAMRCQQAFFFYVEKYGFSIHFATNELIENNLEIHKWHSLQLKNDFTEYLRQFGQLPIASLGKKWKLINELNEYRKIHTQLFVKESLPKAKSLEVKKNASLGVEQLKKKLTVATLREENLLE